MSYSFPDIELLELHNTTNNFMDREYVQAMAEELSSTLEAFKLKGKITDIRMTPFAVLFDVMPDPGESIKSFKNSRIDLEVHMASPVEIVGIGERQYTIGLAIKNWDRAIIGLRDIMQTNEFKNNTFTIPVAGGMDVLGKPFIFDLAQTPHLLVAGATGSGKSVFLNDIIMSIIYTRTPDEVQLVMIDPKMVELGAYNGIPHLYMPVIYDSKKALSALSVLDKEMMRRYEVFASQGVKDIESYNNLVPAAEKLYRIVIIIDEYMEMMMEAPDELEELVKRVSRLARASGIHLVMATQRPSAKVITPEIKANIPCRASFTVVDWRESKTILDRTGAERLLGDGDMLYSSAESAVPTHAQAAYVSNQEVDRVIEKVKANNFVNKE
jgi:S-DNA-T family DNA segregation ATPase FtsK/SpoIIIE